MKKLLLFLFSFFLLKFSAAQILCVQCFQQNDSIGLNVGSANMIINGGFENTNCALNFDRFCPSANGYNCNIVSWLCTGGAANTYASFKDSINCKVEEGTHSPYFGNDFCKACSTNANDTSCLINSGCTVTGIPAGYPLSGFNYGGTAGISLSQTVTGLIPGDIYILEFWTGGESATGTYTTKGLFAVDVGFGNTFLRNPPTPAHTGIGTRFIVEFIAASSTHTIKFTNWGHICTACTELVIDNVRLYTPQYLPPSVTICSVGINDPTENAITVSPNPVTNQLTVNVNHNNQPSTIIIYDMLSNKLIEKTFINTITLNTEFLSKGIYIYEVRTEKGTEKGKLIKE